MGLRRRSALALLVTVATGAGVLVAAPPAGAVAPSSFTITSSQPTSVYGQEVTLFASLTGPSGRPTGTVNFLDGGAVLCEDSDVGGVGSVGIASCDTSTLAVGAHAITATYSGDATYDPAASTDFAPAFTQTVTAASTTTTLDTAPDPSVFSQPVTLTATVSVVAPGGGDPGGTVGFLVATDPITGCTAQPVVSGVATCVTPSLATGTLALTAVFAGTTSHVTSTSAPTSQVVENAATTTDVVADDSTSTWNQPVTFTATVDEVAPATVPPSAGTVNFEAGGTPIAGCAAQPVSTGTATCTTGSLQVGVHTITAEYSGATGYDASTSAGENQTVIPAVTTTAVASDSDPSSFGEAVTFTATVSSTAGTPTGNVVFFVLRDDGSRRRIATVALSAGTASTTTSALRVGEHGIRASYRGAPTFSGSTKASTQTVQRADTRTVIVSSPEPSGAGESVRIRATVRVREPGGGVPNGDVAFFVRRPGQSRALIATVPLDDARAVVHQAFAVGRHRLFAEYRGGASHAPSSGTKAHRVTTN
jgi:hypothetical protein